MTFIVESTSLEVYEQYQQKPGIIIFMNMGFIAVLLYPTALVCASSTQLIGKLTINQTSHYIVIITALSQEYCDYFVLFVSPISNLVFFFFCYSVDVADSVGQSEQVEVKRRRRGSFTPTPQKNKILIFNFTSVPQMNIMMMVICGLLCVRCSNKFCEEDCGWGSGSAQAA